VRKVGGYILLFIFFANSTYLSEVYKLPALVSHFIEHHQQDKKVGLMEFLAMHYWGDDMDDNDQDKDMQLPFKSIDFHHATIAMPVSKTTIGRLQHYTIINLQFPHQDYNLSNPALSSLFRPPQA
jgi:hypothetical protein